MISVDDALARVFALAVQVPAESIPLGAAAGRVLAAPLTAAHSQPPFDSSSMDGYAVRAADLANGGTLRLIGTSQAGQRFSGMMGRGQCVRIFTGAPLPIGADAIVMQEDVAANGNEIVFSGRVNPGQLVRARGSVFAEGQPILPAGTVLAPAHLVLAASANRAKVTVCRRPKIGLLATGDELVLPGTPLGPDQIVGANSVGLTALFAAHGAEIVDLGIVPDDPDRLRAALHAAFDAGIDMLVTTGGASVGERDYVQAALLALGVDLDFWKIAMRPGKPLMFGRRGSVLVFGLPGNPVSAMVTATVIVLPALRQLLGQADPIGPRLRLPLARALPANGIRRHFLRANIEPAPGGSLAMPIPETDSGHIASLAAADALIVQPEDDPGLEAGAVVDVIPL